LLQELFPSFKEIVDVIPTPPKVVTPPRAECEVIEDESTVGYNEPKEDDETTVCDDFDEPSLELDMSVLSLRETEEHIRRSRYVGATKALPQGNMTF
jgi:hypothetical protein